MKSLITALILAFLASHAMASTAKNPVETFRLSGGSGGPPILCKNRLTDKGFYFCTNKALGIETYCGRRPDKKFSCRDTQEKLAEYLKTLPKAE